MPLLGTGNRELATDNLHVIACPHPFQQGREEYSLIPGQSLREILREIQPEIHFYHAHVWVNEDYIPEAYWVDTYPPPGSEITIRVAPRGSIGRMIASIFIMIAAIAVSILTFGALSPLIGVTWAMAVGGMAAVAVGIIGNMVLNMLIPPTGNPSRQQQLLSSGPQSYYLQGGNNTANLYNPVAKVLGRNKISPAYGARTYTEVVGGLQYLRCLFIWGFAPLQIEDLQIGSTPLGDFQGVQIEHRNLTLLLTLQTIAIDVRARTLTRADGNWVNDGVQVGAPLILGGCTTPANDTSYVITAVSQYSLIFAPNTATTSEPGNGAQTAAQGFGSNPLTLFTQDIQEDSLSIELTLNNPAIYTSRLNPNELSLDIACPDGLRGVTSSGGTYPYQVNFSVQYRQTGTTGAWLTPAGVYSDPEDNQGSLDTTNYGAPFNGQMSISGNTSSAVYVGVNWKVDPLDAGVASYDVKVVRTSPGADSIYTQSISYWMALRSIIYENPLQFPVPLAVTAMRIQATYQLNGTLNTLNGVATGIYRDWDPPSSSWIVRPTNNPASLSLEWLTGPHKQAPYLDSQLNMAALIDWWLYCNTEGWAYNKIIDQAADWFETLTEITTAGRATRTWLDGMLSVIIDRIQPFSIGPAFTPRNSANYQFQIAYPILPHAWRIAFVNEQQGYQNDERVVLADGYQIDGLDAWGNAHPEYPLATLFTQLPLQGITNPALIFRHGRYHLAQAALRIVTHQFDAHAEQLVATRGDRIKFAHDVILAGLAQGRVQSLILDESSYLAGVTVDEYCPMEAGTSYAIRFVTQGHLTLYCPVNTVAGLENLSLTFTTSLPPPGSTPWPQPGDLFMFGEAGIEAIDLIVNTIRPNNDLTAKITAIPYDEDIYSADQGTIPVHVSSINLPPEWWPPVIGNVRADGSVLIRDPDGSWTSRILVTFLRYCALGTSITGIEAQYWLTGQQSTSIFIGPVNLDAGEVSLMPVVDGLSYDFCLRYVKRDGSRGPWCATQTQVVAGKTASPSTPEGFIVTQEQQLVYFSWAPIPDLDVAGYFLAYGPMGCTRAVATILTEVMMGTSFNTPMIPAGTWDFLLWSIDTSGNTSASEVRTTYAVVEFYQILEDPLSSLGWPGVLTNMLRNPLTGCLVPVDQTLASGNNFAVFNQFIQNPYATYGYEAPEIDLGADTAARAFARLYDSLGPGESGSIEPQLQFDYRTAAGSYGGFAPWTIGPFMGRYVKFRFLCTAANGNRVITEFQPMVDKSF